MKITARSPAVLRYNLWALLQEFFYNYTSKNKKIFKKNFGIDSRQKYKCFIHFYGLFEALGITCIFLRFSIACKYPSLGCTEIFISIAIGCKKCCFENPC